MAVRNIESSDTLELGFRGKYNETIQEIPVSGVVTSDGKLRLNKFGGGIIQIDLTVGVYTKIQIDNFFSSGSFLSNASEEERGIIQIATLQEVNLGEDDQKVITPFKARNSTIFPFKGLWVQPALDEGYSENMVVIRGSNLFMSLVDLNTAVPGSDPTKWKAIGSSGASKPNIEIAGDTTIDWQNAIVPDTGLTYAEVFGNNIAKVVIAGDDGNGNIVPYEANLTYTLNGNGSINQLHIQTVLIPGKLTFL